MNPDFNTSEFPYPSSATPAMRFDGSSPSKQSLQSIQKFQTPNGNHYAVGVGQIQNGRLSSWIQIPHGTSPSQVQDIISHHMQMRRQQESQGGEQSNGMYPAGTNFSNMPPVLGSAGQAKKQVASKMPGTINGNLV